MKTFLKLTGLLASVIAIFDIYACMISGAGILVGLVSLLLSGISAIYGDLKYVIFTLIVVTFNLFVISVLPEIQDVPKYILALTIGVPYIITFLLIAVGVYRRRTNRSR